MISCPGAAKICAAPATDPEISTCCGHRAIIGVASDTRFVGVACARLRHLFAAVPAHEAFYQRRVRLSEEVLGPIALFLLAAEPGFLDVCFSSTPPRSRLPAPRATLGRLELLPRRAQIHLCS